MRRLFSTFAAGPPGAGLLVLRAAAAGPLVVHMAAAINFSAPVQAAAAVVTGGLGVLLLVGLWTPIAAVLASIDAAYIAASLPHDKAFWWLVGAVAFALALLGPGKWSIDARLFGWKRVDFGDAAGKDSSPD